MKKKIIALLIVSMLFPNTVFAANVYNGWFEFDADVEEVFVDETVEGDEDTSGGGNLKVETEAPIVHREHRYGKGYKNEHGVQYKNGWFWIDNYGDMTMQCYYFDKYGFLVTDDEIGGYRVNSDGQRLKQNAEDDDDIELKEFTMAGPGAENPFALQLFDENLFSERSTSSAGELFEHIYATTSYAYRLASGSSAEGVVVEGYETTASTEEKMHEEGMDYKEETVTAETTETAEDEESNSISKGTIYNFGTEAGPGSMGGMGTSGGAIITDGMNSIRTY